MTTLNPWNRQSTKTMSTTTWRAYEQIWSTLAGRFRAPSINTGLMEKMLPRLLMRCSLSLRTGKDEGMDLLDDHKKAIDGIFRRSQDSYGFIPYRAAATFQRSVQEFLATTFKGLMDSDEGLAAFKILAYLYHKLAEQPIDDSGGEIVELAERLFVLWQGLIRHADRSGKKTMFSWFGDQIK